MSLLVPDTGLLFWMMISFGIVLLALARYGFPVITKAVDKRRAHIAESLQKAEEASRKLAELDARATVVMDKAQKERHAILKDAENARARILEKANSDAAELARQRLARAETEAAEAKRKALDEVMGQIAGISVKIAGKVLESELRDEGKQKQLIEKLLKEDTFKPQ